MVTLVMRVTLTFSYMAEFSIISNNCWSQDFHKAFDLEYTSPFIDILIFGEQYREIVKNIEYRF